MKDYMKEFFYDELRTTDSPYRLVPNLKKHLLLFYSENGYLPNEIQVTAKTWKQFEKQFCEDNVKEFMSVKVRVVKRKVKEARLPKKLFSFVLFNRLIIIGK